ncbi:cellulose synthase/poly-beta-1,6-N-acetylglucosamine synthase-like glycosyltransferase [Clostridium acetobutylicum]|uniref:Predicted membrane protein n=1 Tax=Clostridium acetobutylicum (strain ATCC 824 / DSM 792 / JCM 1419 / IAM 19013 / LMG 5710 / NBRC 13948 / NRRL B-527 / VKM B-1787 / 2291 / W) TaxID=272562 RepID=Q97LJ8_CLOAB|nr:Predicted membrane protein [Clostridium acetobutylicum ATCC 824]ADZ19615.1 membrane protein [Clostridium acetobutylicum EA 2018]AEI31312.1 hypothetical protein SMB_G0575 [Clostridium acetobutylicum DSM 1731]AWV80264.1 hypothetical protein DK921_09185 [Clostridium acetobutylicum]PSM06067.1 hypothetical protein C7T89_09180 [Clostridium sp. NJ4]
MHQRRVGTLTFGFLLIIFGILYFCVNFFNFPFYYIVVHLWPFVLILLGGEILFCNHLASKNNIPLKYDVISFVLIFVMLFFCYGINILITVQKHIHIAI